MIFVLAFALSTAGEFLTTLWVTAAVAKRTLEAVALSGILRATAIAAWLIVVHDPVVAVAYVCGDMLGCYLGVRYRRERQP